MLPSTAWCWRMLCPMLRQLGHLLESRSRKTTLLPTCSKAFSLWVANRREPVAWTFWESDQFWLKWKRPWHLANSLTSYITTHERSALGLYICPCMYDGCKQCVLFDPEKGYLLLFARCMLLVTSHFIHYVIQASKHCQPITRTCYVPACHVYLCYFHWC